MSSPINPLLVSSQTVTLGNSTVPSLADKISQLAVPIILLGIGGYFGYDFYLNPTRTTSLITGSVCALFGIEHLSILLNDHQNLKWTALSVIGVAAGTFSLFFSTYFMTQALFGLRTLNISASLLHLMNTSFCLMSHSTLLEDNTRTKKIQKKTAPQVNYKPPVLTTTTRAKPSSTSPKKPEVKVKQPAQAPKKTRANTSGTMFNFFDIFQPTRSIKGFPNLGNTCYANALLKGLFNSRGYDDSYIKVLERKVIGGVLEDDRSFNLRNQFQTNLRTLKEEYLKEIPDQDVLKEHLNAILRNPILNLPFGSQGDPNELFMRIRDLLQAEGEQSSNVQECRTAYLNGQPDPVSEKSQPLPVIILNENISEVAREAENSWFSSLVSNHNISSPITDLITNYFRVEDNVELRVHDRDELVTRHNQLKHQDTTRLNSLGILLPRFRPDGTRSLARYTEIENEIILPVFDELQNQVVEIRLRPHSIVCHRGSSRNGGHYVSYIRGEEGRWFLHNDSSVEEIIMQDKISTIQKDAYQVFYEVVR